MTFDQLCEIYDGMRDRQDITDIRSEIDRVWNRIERATPYDDKLYSSRDEWRDVIANSVARRMGLGEYSPVLITEYEDALKSQEIYAKVKS